MKLGIVCRSSPGGKYHLKTTECTLHLMSILMIDTLQNNIFKIQFLYVHSNSHHSLNLNVRMWHVQPFPSESVSEVAPLLPMSASFIWSAMLV